MEGIITVEKSFKEFYLDIGFEKYPFRDRTAEKEDSTKLFIKPHNYALLEDILLAHQTAIVCGNRGSGKTIMLSDLKSKVPSNTLVSYVDNYELLPIRGNKLEFYSLILQNVIRELLIYLVANKNMLKKLSKDDKIFLSFLIMKYSDIITDEQLYSKIENIQLGKFKKFINKTTPSFTLLLNYGTTALTNFGNDLLNKHFGAFLPSVDEGAIRKIIPDIHFKIANEFKSVEISYALLDKSLKLVKKVMNSIPIVLIDRLDEDLRLENDAEIIAEFIKDLVCDNNLLLNSNIQLIISVWQIPFSNLSTIFRSSKHTVFDITWDRKQLEVVLNRRLLVYSNNKISDYKMLFSPEVSGDDIENIFTLSNQNPRDLWGLLDSIINNQFSINADSKYLLSVFARKVQALKKKNGFHLL